MKLLNYSVSKSNPVILPIAIWPVPKTSVVNGNMSIGGGNEDL